MMTTAQLKKAVEEALNYLRTLPDVKEAEVFASANGNLLTRLNYTSHIPSNGVEEPKSTEAYGVGIQAVFRTEDGLKIGFGSEPSDLRLEGAQRALDKARQGAVIDPEFRALPGPTGERRLLRRYHDPRLMKIRDEDLVDAGWRIMNGALRTFAASERLRELAGSEAGIARLGLILGGDVTILQERVAVGSFNLPRVETDESTLIMAFITAMVEARDSKGSGWQTATRLDGFTEQAGVEAARSAIDAIGGQRVKSGEYRVIFGKQPVTDLLNNLVLPAVQAGAFYSSSSPFMGKLGQPVASEQLTIYDDGAAKGLMGSKGITCEGLPTGRSDLIKRGVLVGLLSNHYETQRLINDPQAKEKLGVDPLDYASALVPRNGFRFGRGGGRAFDMQPGVAPTNVIVEGDPVDLDELIRRVGEGLLIGRIWYTYPINGLRAGDFTCTVVGDSYIIRDGKIVAPLRPNTVRINDNIHNVLKNVIGVGRDRKGTLVWAADEVVYATEIAVSRVRVDEIAGFMDTLMPGG